MTSGARLAPSSLNCTPTTPTLSVALADTVTVPATVPAAGAVMETAGGVPGDGAKGMGAVEGGGGVPGDRIGRGGDCRAEVDAIQFELDADDAHVVGGGRRDGDGSGDRRTRCR